MKDYFMRNLKLKILALLLALLAWIYVQSSPSNLLFEPGLGFRERQVELYVQYQNLPPTLKLAETTEKVEVSMREGVRGFTPSQPIRAFVDLSQIEVPGRYFLEIQVDLPDRMKLLYKRPRYALILVEEVND